MAVKAAEDRRRDDAGVGPNTRSANELPAKCAAESTGYVRQPRELDV